MNKKFLLILLLNSVIVFSQKINLDKSILTIPDSISKNANLITRYHQTKVVINSKRNMHVNYNMLYTVKNKYGDEHPLFLAYYDDNESINNIKITIYDAFGKVIKKVKKKEINDVAASDGFSLYSDNRIKYYKHIPNKYPYSIEISYQTKTSNTAFLPRWSLYESYFNSIQKMSFSISYPNDLKLNFEESNFDSYNISKKSESNRIDYTVSNVKVIKPEALSSSFSKKNPHVIFALNKFSLEGVDGNAENWHEFGKWMYERLLKGRGDLSETTKNEIKTLVKNEENSIERAKLVYKYMQDKTRYISVQIGIGGWKPMLAKDVDELKYGDCKALVNYTQALLKEANVESLYTIVYSGEKKDIKKNLISVQGNHAILMLPTKKDTIWLECTSQKLPFGQTGSTNDRDVLVVSPNGGKIVHTNKYDAAYNFQLIKGSYTIGDKGNIDAIINIDSKGKQYNWSYDIEFDKKKDQILHYKEKFFNILDADIEIIELKNNKKEITFTEKLEIKANHYSEFIGDEIMLRLNAFNIYNRLPKRAINRKYPVIIKHGYKDQDEITINLPKNYTANNLPKAISMKNEFGIYEFSVKKITENQLVYKRVLLFNEGTYPKASYKKYRTFIKDIIKSDKQKIILNKI